MFLKIFYFFSEGEEGVLLILHHLHSEWLSLIFAVHPSQIQSALTTICIGDLNPQQAAATDSSTFK